MHIVLECLCQHQLYLKPEKCEFEQTKVEYLGLIISHETAEMDPVKVAGVVEWPEGILRLVLFGFPSA
ncbi:hypothetical protein C0995_005973, partial [Termitomyces sp. Mi166